MFALERLRAIENIARQKGRLTVSELASHLGSSEITIRRDLRKLEAQKKIVRAHGGVLHPEFIREEPRFERKAVDAAAVKAALARRVIESLPERGQIFIDSGTTCLEVGRLLLDRRELTLITNSLPLLQLGAEAGARVVATGGEIRPLSLALVGALALDWLKALRFDAAVLGASGLHPEEGASTTELSESSVKQLASARSARRILVAHSSKWAQPAAVTFAPWSNFHHFVTDAPLSKADKSRLQREGVTVDIVRI